MTKRCFRIAGLLACLALWACGQLLAGAEPAAPSPPRERGRWRRGLANGKNEPAVRSAFQEVLEGASAATVRVLAEGEEVALGAVVEPDGYLVSKASVLHGRTKIVCRFKDGTERDAKIVGENATHDLALLRVEATNLAALSWREGDLPPGSLVATTAPGNQPVAIGVASTVRRVGGRPEPPKTRGWLGIELRAGPSGVAVDNVASGSPAAKADLHAGDEIRRIDGAAVTSTNQVVTTVGAHPSGQTIKLLVHRKEKDVDKDVEIIATMGKPQPVRLPQDAWGGGPFSDRRSGFPQVLPHDTPLQPKDCGGPLVDTEGRAVGINIARALRVTTYALPARIVQETVTALKREPEETPGR
ncbi:MAG: S1C family serine protease [Thermoguttaceae bacterium]